MRQTDRRQLRLYNKYVRPNTRAEMYADCVSFCPLVTHVEYAPRALLRFGKRWDRQTDGRTDAKLLYYAASVMTPCK